MGQRRGTGCFLCGMCCSLIVVVLSLIAIFVVLPLEVQKQLRLKLPMLNPDSILFQCWQDTDLKNLNIERSFWMFHVNNPGDIYHFHETPDYSIRGPYVFKEHTYSPLESIKWNTKAELEFNYLTDLTFVPEKSIDKVTKEQLSLDDHIVTQNFAMWSGFFRLSRLTPTLPPMERPLVAEIICNLLNQTIKPQSVSNSSAFINRTVQELLFGFHDPLWEVFHEHSKLVNYNVPTIFHALFNGSQPAPSQYTLRYGQKCPVWNQQWICNSSANNTNVIDTGAEYKIADQIDVNGGLELDAAKTVGSYHNIGGYKKWAGQDKLWWWGDDNDGACQRIEGSNGMTFPPGLTEASKPYVFFDALARKVMISFQQYTTNSGLDTLQFGLADEDQTVGPMTKCYGQKYDHVMNETAALYGPAYITPPYFYKVDLKQNNIEEQQRGRTVPLVDITIDGIPLSYWQKGQDPADYETVLHIEPVTGTMMEAHARVQFGTFMKDIDEVEGCRKGLGGKPFFPGMLPRDITLRNGTVVKNSHFPTTMTPFFYMDRHAKMPQELADTIYRKAILPVKIAKGVGGALCALSLLIAIACVVQLVRRSRSAEDHEYVNLSGDDQLRTPTREEGEANIQSAPRVTTVAGKLREPGSGV